MEKLIWQPEFGPGCDFSIYLDRGFAEEMIQSKILPEINSFSDVMNSLNNIEYSTSMTVIVFITAIFHILYFVIFEKKLRQSVGKMLFNLYVESKTKDFSVRLERTKRLLQNS